MNWLIVGHGALASLWAHHLIAAGEQVTIVTRDADQATPPPCSDNSDHSAAAGTACPTFTLETDKMTHTQAIPCVQWSQLTDTDLSQAHVLIMVKAWQLEDVIHSLAQQLHRTRAQLAAVVISHNGLGAAEKALLEHADWPVYDLVTTHGAWRKTAYQTVHAGHGNSYIGPRQQRRESACSAPPVWFPAFANAFPPMSWEPVVLPRRWHKLAINCAINPLASLAGKPNGVLKNPCYREDIEGVCEETERVANVVLGQGVVQKDELVAQVYQVIKMTSENTCSMLQDLQQGNPTEIDYLNGYISRLGEAFAIPTPINRRLQEAVTACQAGSASGRS